MKNNKTYKNFFTNHYGLHDLQSENLKNLKTHLSDIILTNGKYCEKFEKKISKQVNSKYSVVCNNGTSALMLALLSLLGNDRIYAIVPNINFVAVANIIKLLSGKIILCDVNKDTGMVDDESFLEILKECKKKNIKPNVFLPVHYAGEVLNLKKIYKICKKNKIFVIEDGCHSFGSSKKINRENIKVGSCKYSDITTFSFHPVKNITTIEGGALTTNNKNIYTKLKLLRSHSLKRTYHSDPYNLDPISSLNFRLGEINALIGINQINRINLMRKKRNFLIKNYLKKFEKFEHVKFMNKPTQNIFWHLLVAKLGKKYSNKKEKLMKFLKSKQIGCQIHYKPLSMHNSLKEITLLCKTKNSNLFYRSQLSLPLHTKLNLKDIDYIFKNFKKFDLTNN